MPLHSPWPIFVHRYLPCNILTFHCSSAQYIIVLDCLLSPTPFCGFYPGPPSTLFQHPKHQSGRIFIVPHLPHQHDTVIDNMLPDWDPSSLLQHVLSTHLVSTVLVFAATRVGFNIISGSLLGPLLTSSSAWLSSISHSLLQIWNQCVLYNFQVRPKGEIAVKAHSQYLTPTMWSDSLSSLVLCLQDQSLFSIGCKLFSGGGSQDLCLASI